MTINKAKAHYKNYKWQKRKTLCFILHLPYENNTFLLKWIERNVRKGPKVNEIAFVQPFKSKDTMEWRQISVMFIEYKKKVEPIEKYVKKVQIIYSTRTHKVNLSKKFKFLVILLHQFAKKKREFPWGCFFSSPSCFTLKPSLRA